MQNSVHRTYFTAVELESGKAASLLIGFEPGRIVARLKSADDEQWVVLGRDDGQSFKSRTVEALLFLVATGFEEFRGVRYSYLPHVYGVDVDMSKAAMKSRDQTLH